MTKPRVATVWLDGCAGCHMAVLDLDEKILPILNSIQLVYGPLVDMKEFPASVDITLVEGAISSEEDLHKIRMIRERTKILIALGDCAVTSNVPSYRNQFKTEELFQMAYQENATCQLQDPRDRVPALLKQVKPLHAYVKVDYFLPGCPPLVDNILLVLQDLLEGKSPQLEHLVTFG